jgi:hypothetical protein
MGRPGGLGPELEPPPGADAAGHPVAFAGRRDLSVGEGGPGEDRREAKPWT